MEIISITRRTNGLVLPEVFTVGEPPTADSPPVQGIKFFETNNYYAKAYRGPLYVIDFGTDTKRLIPANEVVDIAVSRGTSTTALPKLPSGDSSE